MEGKASKPVLSAAEGCHERIHLFLKINPRGEATLAL
jgi:hypothetical protein